MSTPEGKVKARVKRYLQTKNIYFHFPVMNGMGAPTLDVICCFMGQFFAIETKAPGKKLTSRQEITKDAMEMAGGKVFVIDGDIKELKEWVEEVELIETQFLELEAIGKYDTPD